MVVKNVPWFDDIRLAPIPLSLINVAHRCIDPSMRLEYPITYCYIKHFYNRQKDERLTSNG
jgi:hypothetical protein